MSLITALSHSQPDDGESSRVAAWAVRRLSDSLVDSALPSDIARPLALLEPLLHEVEETLRLAAETTSSASTSPASRSTAEQLGQASATTVLLRLHLEQITTRLHGYGTNFPADTAVRTPRAAAAQRTVPETGFAPRCAQPSAASTGMPTATAGTTVRR